jgi:hypothetical protein
MAALHRRRAVRAHLRRRRRRDEAVLVDGGSKDGTPGGQKQYKLA